MIIFNGKEAEDQEDIKVSITGGVNIICPNVMQVNRIVHSNADIIDQTSDEETGAMEATPPQNARKAKTTIRFNGCEFNSFEEMNDYLTHEGAGDPNNDLSSG